MTIKFVPIAIILVLAAALSVAAQKRTDINKAPEDSKQTSAPVTSSAAHAELILRKTELQAELESLLIDYTEEYPKVKEIRFVLTLFDRDLSRLSKVKPADSGKLTVALGKLIVRKIELETELWNLQKNYQDQHPDVKRAKRKVEIFDKSVNELLN